MTACFVFDLDGTVTKQELLPIIAGTLDLGSEMRLLTELTLNGTIPFEDSFRLRCAALRTAPIDKIWEFISEVELDPHIEKFIHNYRQRCFVASGNLDIWVEPLVKRLDCQAFTSIAMVENNYVKGVEKILDKSAPVIGLKAKFDRVVVIGESVNDLPMFEVADIGISFGGVHPPVTNIVRSSAYVCYSGESLCRLLNTL